MVSYFFKRVFLLFVTLFGISLIQFLVINSMPGRPSGGNANPSEDQNVEALTTESDRKWRASYNLDKPILFNMRAWLKEEEVLDVLNNRISGKPYDKMQAEWELDDWGSSAVRDLVNIANDKALDQSIRLMALQRLPANIQRQKILLNPNWDYDSKNYQEAMAWNQEVSAEDSLARIHGLKKKSEISLEKINQEALWWSQWFEARKARFVPNGILEKMSGFFFETRYAYYVKNLLKGDLGQSKKKTRVIDEIAERIPVTVALNSVAFFFIYLIALPVGILAAVKRSGLFDTLSSVILFMLYSLPTFYVGLIFLYMTTMDLPSFLSFPPGDWESIRYADFTTWGRFTDRAWHSVLPVICIVYGSLAGLSRFARTGLLDIIESDYIRTARAKGLRESVVVIKHALRNGALPVLTLLGSQIPVLFGGSVIIEVIFNIRGIGLLSFESIASQDYSVIAGVMLISAVLVLVAMFVVDFLYTLIDPRISFE